MKKIQVTKKHNFLSENNLFSLLYLFLAWSLAVTQPLMSVLGKQPVFLIAHDVRGWLFVGLTLAFNFIPPLAVWLVAGFFGLLSKHLKELIIRLTLTFLLFLFMVQLLVDLPLIYAFFSAIGLAIVAVFILIRVDALKTFALWFSLAGLIFVFTFLFVAPSKQLLPTFKTVTSESKAASDNPVFLLILDEFPLLALLKDNMEIDESRFPTFAKLSKEVTWYPNATAISSATELAIPAILSGIKPSLTKVRSGTYEQYPNNIFTQFSSSHKIHAVENSTRMCPSHLCQSVVEKPFQLLWEDLYVSYLYIIYPKDTRHKLPPVNDRWIGFMREIKNQKRKNYDFSERLNKFKKFYSTVKKYPKNTLHFLHVLLPHAPWTILPNLDLYGFYEKDGVPGELDKTKYNTQYNHQWTNDSWATRLSWRRELLQIGAVDTLVGQMLEEIKKQGLYDDAMIVIVADHGASYIPGLSRRYAHDETIPDIAKIPLFIKYPQQKTGKIDKGFASNLDILPTLLDVFSIKTDEKIDGISLVDGQKRLDEVDMIQEKFAVTQLPKNSNILFNQHLKNKNSLFSDMGWQGVYHPSDSVKFYGEDVSTLHVKQIIPNAIKLNNANLYKSVKKESSYIPVYYRLTKLLDKIDTQEILVAVNGTLVSHCYMFVHAANDCAGLIAPEEFSKLYDAPIRLQFFSVLKFEDDAYTVDELKDINDVKAEIIIKDNKDYVKFSSDKIIPIDHQNPLFGAVSLRLIENGTTYHLDGWAGNTLTGKPAIQIYIFIDNKLFSIVDGGIPKPYLFTRYGSKEFINSGFQVTIPFTQYPNIQQHKIRVFATLDNVSFNELNYHPSKQHELFAAFDTKTNQKIPVNANAVFTAKLALANIETAPKLKTIDAFNDAFSLISAGDWLPAKNHKRWIGATTYVQLPLEDNPQKIQLNIQATPVIYQNINTRQRLKIYLNDKFIKEISFTKKESKTITIDTKSLSPNDVNVLKLEMPDAIIPHSHDKGIDSRFLSFYLYQFSLDMKSL